MGNGKDSGSVHYQMDYMSTHILVHDLPQMWPCMSLWWHVSDVSPSIVPRSAHYLGMPQAGHDFLELFAISLDEA